jgi:hypothetical protein
MPAMEQLAGRYVELRRTLIALNGKLPDHVTREMMGKGGRELGILQRGMFAFEIEEEASVLMDRCIHVL